MRFEQVKKSRKDSKINKLIDEFIATRYDRVEIINEEDYETDAQMTAAIRFAIKSYYEGKVKVSRAKNRVFLSKVKQDEKAQ